MNRFRHINIKSKINLSTKYRHLSPMKRFLRLAAGLKCQANKKLFTGIEIFKLFILTVGKKVPAPSVRLLQ